MYLSKNIHLNSSINVLYYSFMVKEFCLTYEHFQSANQEWYQIISIRYNPDFLNFEEGSSTRNLDMYKP